MTQTTTEFPNRIVSICTFPNPPKLTFLEWIGWKKRPPIPPQKLYVATENAIYVSDIEGGFDVKN